MTLSAERLRELHIVLDSSQLERVRLELVEALHQGLQVEGGPIPMLPAFLAPPDPAIAGEAVAVDVGGTHLRAARVRLGSAGGAALASEVAQAPLPGAAGRPPADLEDFYAAHLDVLGRVGCGDKERLGYCFSYPISCLPDGDAILERWTKEVRVAGLVDQRVGRHLRRVLEIHHREPASVVVLNDTIAALAGGAATPRVDPSRCIGLIVGTGSNMGAYLPVGQLGKLREAWPAASPMAVNFESGSFEPRVLGPVDEQVDRGSVNPGVQRFEKAVSGAYLGRLFTAACAELGLAPPAEPVSAATVSRLASAADGGEVSELARALLDRSADLVAAALAGADGLLGGEGPLTVCAEGSLFWKAPGYADRVRSGVDRMCAALGCDGPCRILSVPHANLVGSAAAALPRPR